MSSQPSVIRPSAGPALDRARQLLDDDPAQALNIVRQIVAIAPHNAAAHRLAARALRQTGKDEEAEVAEMEAIRASTHDPELQKAAEGLLSNELHVAEPILRKRLKEIPTDVAAIRMLAELAGRIGRYKDAENLLRRALELAPAFAAARSNLATVLHRQNRTEEALEELEVLLAKDAANPGHANLKAAVLTRVGEFEEALALYESVLKASPHQPKIWMSYGHALKTVGRQEDSVAAYRRALSIRPALGEVWWSLANLKTVKLDDADIAIMQDALRQSRLSEDDVFHLHFSLGKAFEDAGNVEASFNHYASGNALRNAQLEHDPGKISRQVQRSIDTFTPAFFAERKDQGCQAADPIFIVGMPRAGSTLIEQILSSHSQVEGTMELPDIPALAKKLGLENVSHLTGLAGATPDTLHELGEEYLERTRIQRKENKPFFIDKAPGNWLFVGLIQLILPNARIIDARRHPLDCGFSNFKQHYARGQAFSYKLENIGSYYSNYVRLMAHFDAVLPGRVHRVIHERLIDDPENEIRALLSALDLPFEESCLHFHENRRAVRTASSEQVRRPINRAGVDQWQPYSQWLDPLRAALGPVLDAYPGVPERDEFVTVSSE